jgi:hypothetical protein
MKKISIITLFLAVLLGSYSLSSFTTKADTLTTPKEPPREVVNTQNYEKILLLEFQKDQLQKQIDSLCNFLFASPDSLQSSANSRPGENILLNTTGSGESIKAKESMYNNRNDSTGTERTNSGFKKLQSNIKDRVNHTRAKHRPRDKENKSIEVAFHKEINNL